MEFNLLKVLIFASLPIVAFAAHGFDDDKVIMAAVGRVHPNDLDVEQNIKGDQFNPKFMYYDDNDNYNDENDNERANKLIRDDNTSKLLEPNEKRSSRIHVYRRGCIHRNGSCDNRPNDCCHNSSCRCNLWGNNCRCQRIGLFQKWG